MKEGLGVIGSGSADTRPGPRCFLCIESGLFVVCCAFKLSECPFLLESVVKCSSHLTVLTELPFCSTVSVVQLGRRSSSRYRNVRTLNAILTGTSQLISILIDEGIEVRMSTERKPYVHLIGHIGSSPGK